MRTVPTDLLRAFVAVAETQNFTRAGEILFRTQAAVSMQIRRLEDQLGSALFERDSRGTLLTDQGKFLLSYAKRILQLNDELLDSLELGRARLRDRSFAESASHLFRDVPGRPGRDRVRCRYRPFAEMKQQHLDLVLTVSRPSPMLRGFASRQPLFWVGAADDAAHKQDPLPLALFPHGCACRELALEALGAAGRRWKVVLTSSANSAIIGAVMAGMAVAAMESCLIGPGLRRLSQEALAASAILSVRSSFGADAIVHSTFLAHHQSVH